MITLEGGGEKGGRGVKEGEGGKFLSRYPVLIPPPSPPIAGWEISQPRQK